MKKKKNLQAAVEADEQDVLKQDDTAVRRISLADVHEVERRATRGRPGHSSASSASLSPSLSSREARAWSEEGRASIRATHPP